MSQGNTALEKFKSSKHAKMFPFTDKDINYIVDSILPKYRTPFDEKKIKAAIWNFFEIHRRDSLRLLLRHDFPWLNDDQIEYILNECNTYECAENKAQQAQPQQGPSV